MWRNCKLAVKTFTCSVVKVVKIEKRNIREKMRNINKMCLVLLAAFSVEIFSREIELGPCYLQFLEPCANNSIQFFLFSSDTPTQEPVLLDNISPNLNLDSNETTSKKFKMIIHGYGGHLDFSGSKQIRNGIPKNIKIIIYSWINPIASIDWTATCLSCDIPQTHTIVSIKSETFFRPSRNMQRWLRVRVKSRQNRRCTVNKRLIFQLRLLSTRSMIPLSDDWWLTDWCLC